MKTIFNIFICATLLGTLAQVNGQTLSPKAMPSSGGYSTAGGLSLSWTLGETFNTTLKTGVATLTQGQQQPELDLVVIDTPANLCPGSSFAIAYKAVGFSNPANTFTAQLSDAWGSFASPVAIGSITSAISGSIPVIIPQLMAADTGYRFRIVSGGAPIFSSQLVAVSINANVIWYLDADNDGHYISSQSACTSPGLHYNKTATTLGDCDDNDANVYKTGAIGQSGSAVNNIVANTTAQFGSDCDMIAKVQSTGLQAISGTTSVEVWVDAQTPVYEGAPYLRRHFEVKPFNNTNHATSIVTLYYSQADFDLYNSYPGGPADLPTDKDDSQGISNFSIYQYSGTNNGSSGIPNPNEISGVEIIKAPALSLIWNDTKQWWEASFAASGFSGYFAGGRNLIILPVELLSFTASLSPNKQAANLQWHVATQQNIKEYQIERATNDTEFAAMSKVPANNLASTQYYFTDNQLPAGEKTRYRLRIINTDGKASYSKVVSVTNFQPQTITIYPIPAKNEAWLKGGDAALIGTQAMVMDTQGRVLQQLRISGWPQRINTAALAAGTYYIKLNNKVIRMIVAR